MLHIIPLKQFLLLYCIEIIFERKIYVQEYELLLYLTLLKLLYNDLIVT